MLTRRHASIRTDLILCGLAITLAVGSVPAFAASPITLDVDGFADLRMVTAPAEKSWVDGGLGKLRYGGNGVDGQVLGALEATLGLGSNLSVFADARFDDSQYDPFTVLEAYVRYQPLTNAAWSWTLKGGEFFPPVSLENDGPGWTSTWTLTPSSINSWVGEELRTIGAESRVDWHGSLGALSLTGALFVDNDPAGVLIADRGWAMGDVITGLPSKLRLPDVYAGNRPPPIYADPYMEIDGRVGWYAEASGRLNGVGTLRLIRYDNEADPSAKTSVFAWHTNFWCLGADTDIGTPIGDITLMGQLMIGDTTIAPGGSFYSDTGFRAGYLLAGWTEGDWRVAGRFDLFSTQETTNFPGEPDSERGYALTGDVTWRARSWLRITGEVLRMDSYRRQRLDETPAVAPGVADYQTQVNVRFLF